MKRNYTVEFYRFITIIFIAIFHFGIQYTGKFHWPKGGYLGVEFFFILSGFFLMREANKDKIKGESDSKLSVNYLLSKLKRLYPDYLLIILIFIFCNIFKDKLFSAKYVFEWLYKEIWELLFLHDFGIPDIHMSVTSTWFLSSLVINSYLIYYLILKNKDLFVGFIAPVTTILIYAYASRKYGSLSIQGEYSGIFYGALIRSWADICMGVLSYNFYSFMHKWLEYEKSANIKKYKKIIFLFNLIEIYMIVSCLYIINIGFKLDDFNIVIPFVVIIVLAFLNITFISRLLNKKIFKSLGEISYSIYLNHLLVSTILTVYFPNRNYKIMLIIFLIISIVMSYGTNKFIKKIINKGQR